MGVLIRKEEADKLTLAKCALLAMQRYPWEQGVAMQAFLEMGEDAVVIAMAKEAAYRQDGDGRLAALGDFQAVTDPCANGEGLLYACSITGDEMLKTASEKCLEWAMEKAPRNEDGIVFHVQNEKQIWADSMYMLPPYLAAAGKYEEAVRQMKGYFQILYHPDKKLLSHMWDDKNKKFIREAFWGVGNGWALAGLARVIDLLPEQMEEERKELINMAEKLIAGLLPHMREDGLFHDEVDDSSTFVETNLSQMLSYTLYRGIRCGWLDRKYSDIAERLRKAAKGCVDSYGLVQGVCGAPTFDKPGVAPEGQAFYLLMETEAEKYLKD